MRTDTMHSDLFGVRRSLAAAMSTPTSPVAHVTGTRDEANACTCPDDDRAPTCPGCRREFAQQNAEAQRVAVANAKARDAEDLAWGRLVVEGKSYACGGDMRVAVTAAWRASHGWVDRPFPMSHTFRVRQIVDTLWAERITPLKEKVS